MHCINNNITIRDAIVPATIALSLLLCTVNHGNFDTDSMMMCMKWSLMMYHIVCINIVKDVRFCVEVLYDIIQFKKIRDIHIFFLLTNFSSLFNN